MTTIIIIEKTIIEDTVMDFSWKSIMYFTYVRTLTGNNILFGIGLMG